mgnify:CR=1 FL=1
MASRGRPKKNPVVEQSPESEVILPESLEQVSETGNDKSDKSGKTKKSSLEKDKIKRLSRQVEGWHLAAAKVTQIPELAITTEESIEITTAVVNVIEEYDLVVDPKTAAILALLGTAVMIYTPKVPYVLKAVNNKKDKETIPYETTKKEVPWEQ